MTARQTDLTLVLSRFLLLFMGILLVYLMVSFGRQVAVSYQRRQELDRVRDKQAAALTESERLKGYLEYATSEPAAEEWARTQGWAKTGEVPVIVVAPGVEPTPAPPGALPASSPVSNQQAWWELFFGTR